MVSTPSEEITEVTACRSTGSCIRKCLWNLLQDLLHLPSSSTRPSTTNSFSLINCTATSPLLLKSCTSSTNCGSHRMCYVPLSSQYDSLILLFPFIAINWPVFAAPQFVHAVTKSCLEVCNTNTSSVSFSFLLLQICSRLSVCI